MNPRTVWGGIFAAGAVVEVYGLTNEDRRAWTLSRVARATLRCHTPEGRAVTTVALGAGSAWLVNHLLSVTPKE